ncbi:hypothetical protein [Paenibacillus ginsengarvi]|uniref:Uncharacterized protein n=1 Tax=Paenibacillus ginsengarvi TaxID=400777 RepID=A0A3B0CH01_9BACL|nr:hypothetical protein [Paenibacillus ginsengarvi]RKN84783.1 hypothetical protein D7M11_12420 [Paenibacillus ginsengarvi]
MWKTVIVIAFAAAAGTLELPRAYRRSIKEAVVYAVMLAAGTVLSIAAMRTVDWPSPLLLLVPIFRPLHVWIESLFG